MGIRVPSLGWLALLAGVLFLPLTAQADNITPEQVGVDLAIVNADIANNPLAFWSSTIAPTDLTLGIAAMILGDIEVAEGDNAGAQVDFSAAINDLNGVLGVLGDAPFSNGDPPGDPPAVPEPSTMSLLGIGAMALGAAFWRKVRQDRHLHAESLPAL